MQSACLAREARWKNLFELAWDGKGFTIQIDKVPDDILDLFIVWRNERVEENNRKIRDAESQRMTLAR